MTIRDLWRTSMMLCTESTVLWDLANISMRFQLPYVNLRSSKNSSVYIQAGPPKPTTSGPRKRNRPRHARCRAAVGSWRWRWSPDVDKTSDWRWRHGKLTVSFPSFFQIFSQPPRFTPRMNLLEGLNEEAPSESIPWKKDALNLLACKMWEVKTQPETPEIILFSKCCQKLQWWQAGMSVISQDV